MEEDNTRKSLLNRIKGFAIEGFDFTSLPTEKLVEICQIHKTQTIDYTSTHPPSFSVINHTAEYLEKRKIYVNGKITEELNRYQQGLETQLKDEN